jgi:hypothetical protein
MIDYSADLSEAYRLAKLVPEMVPILHGRCTRDDGAGALSLRWCCPTSVLFDAA